jgi:flagellar hook-length control protein FliK
MTTAPSARAEADGARAAEADPIAATTAAPERASEPSRPFRPTAPRSGPAPANDSIERIAVAIKIAARHGMDRIQIKLQPEHLGSVEITLDVRDGNRVQATVASDRSATHELLQRDARGLERALEQAGLKVTTGDLTFAWRQGGQSSHGYGHEAPAFLERPDAVASETEPDPALVARAASWRDPARLIDLDA